MKKFINDEPFNYVSKNGTVFDAERSDLRGGVKVRQKTSSSFLNIASDFAEFAAYHALMIHPSLNGFSGYDNIKYEVEER